MTTKINKNIQKSSKDLEFSIDDMNEYWLKHGTSIKDVDCLMEWLNERDYDSESIKEDVEKHTFGGIVDSEIAGNGDAVSPTLNSD